MTEPADPPGEPQPRPPSEPTPRDEPFLFRILRSTIAPPMLDDAGHDAPLSPRGRLLFWGAVAGLVVAIVVVFVLTLTR